MRFISKIEGATAWLRSSGVYRQVDLYRRGEHIYAKWGGGYIRLDISGDTSHPKVRWIEADPGEAVLDLRNGRIPTFIADGAELTAKQKAKLIPA